MWQVEIKTTKDTPDAGSLQKAADFVHAFILGAWLRGSRPPLRVHQCRKELEQRSCVFPQCTPESLLAGAHLLFGLNVDLQVLSCTTTIYGPQNKHKGGA